MRIVFVISSLAAGGAQRVIVDLTDGLAARGHEVSLITYNKSVDDHFQSPPSVKRVELDLLWNSRSIWHSVTSSLQRARRMRAAILACRPHAVVSFIDLTNVLVIASTMGLRIGRVISERIDPRLHPIPRHWRVARRLLYPFADALVIQTEALRVWGRWIVAGRKLHVIPNAARAMSVAPSELDSPRDRTVLAVGRLHSQKGFDLLMRAFAASRLASDGWKLTIVGEGPDREPLTRLARELRIDDHTSLPGVSPEPERTMARCGIFVLSSRFEGFPNVLLEAMACGAPAIAFDCPCGPAEIIDPGRNGLLVGNGDVVALAAAMDELASSAERRRDLGAEARKVVQRYSRDRVTGAWEELITSVSARGLR